MYIQDKKKADLLELRGYLEYLIFKLQNLAEEEKETHLKEINQVIDEVIYKTVDMYLDNPGILKELRVIK